jgi:hypothetical protein
LAIDRLDLGWLPLDAVRVADGATGQLSLRSATGAKGTRLLIVPIDDHRALTIEQLPDSGYDDHLPSAGVVVHMIDDSPAQCGATTRCTDLQRVQQIVAVDGGDRTLLRAGDVVTTDGWVLRIDSIGADDATLTVSH